MSLFRKPGCRRIVEWAKKTGRVKGAEQQELVEFARKVLEQAEKNGDIFKPTGGGGVERTDDAPPRDENAPQALVGKLIHSSVPSNKSPLICILLMKIIKMGI